MRRVASSRISSRHSTHARRQTHENVTSVKVPTESKVCMCVCVCVCSPFSLSTGAEEPLEKLNSVAGEAKSHGEAGGAKVDRFVNEAAATLLTRRFRPMPLPLRPEPIPGEPPPSARPVSLQRSFSLLADTGTSSGVSQSMK